MEWTSSDDADRSGAANKWGSQLWKVGNICQNTVVAAINWYTRAGGATRVRKSSGIATMQIQKSLQSEARTRMLEEISIMHATYCDKLLYCSKIPPVTMGSPCLRSAQLGAQ